MKERVLQIHVAIGLLFEDPLDVGRREADALHCGTAHRETAKATENETGRVVGQHEERPKQHGATEEGV